MPKFPMTPKIQGQLQQAMQQFHAMPDGEEKEFARRALQDTMQNIDPGMPTEGPLDAVGKAFLKAADFVPGITRTAVNEAVGPGEVTAASAKDDWKRALLSWDPAYGRADFRRRAGDTSSQPGADLAADMAYAPSTASLAKSGVSGLRNLLARAGYIKGTTAIALRAGEEAAAAQAAKSGTRRAVEAAPGFMLDPMGNTAEAAGKGYYGLPFKEADQAAALEHAVPPSEIMLANGGSPLPAMGTSASLANQAERLKTQAADRVEAAISGNANNPAANVHKKDIVQSYPTYLLDRETVGPLENSADRVLNDMSKELSAYKGSSQLDVRSANELKKADQSIARAQKAYSEVPDAGGMPSRKYVQNRLESQMSGEAHRLRARDLRLAIENSLDNAKKGLGGQVHDDNRAVQSLMAASEPLADNAKEGVGETIKRLAPMGLLGGAIDMGAQHAGVPHGPLPWTLAATGVAASLPLPQTVIGGMMARYGKIPAAALRAKLLEDANEPSPWQLLNSDLQQKGMK